MRLLLDTHALLWWLLGDSRLAPPARAAIADEESVVHVSAATAWEIATKTRIGKLPGAEALAQNLTEVVEANGFRSLPISLEHGQRAGSLPGPHKDPFDRMLVAQAQAENLVLVSNEEIFDQYGVERLWDGRGG
ncbi:MAG TPA: type II toxin-antitoxin system VapC family toxin [Longimicrobium sp.]|jgi:PIN domain nuclease of toxin-antitoxin system